VKTGDYNLQIAQSRRLDAVLVSRRPGGSLGYTGTSNNGRFCRVMGHKIGAVSNLIFDRRFHGSFCAGCFG
jgi:hypothetical protein